MNQFFAFSFVDFCKCFFLLFCVKSHSSIPCLLYILRVISNGKMKRIDAFFIVARMQYKLSFWYFSIMNFIRKSMRLMQFFPSSTFLENSVTSCCYSSYPIPARFTFRNLFPKSFFCCFSQFCKSVSHAECYHISIVGQYRIE